MRPIVYLAVTSIALHISTPMAFGDDGQKAFKSWSNLFAGSVWTRTSDGEQHRHSYQKVLNGRFLELTAADHGNPSKVLIGIDPKTKKCTFWQFGQDGSVTKYLVTQVTDQVWTLDGTGSGPDGKSRYRSRVTRVDANTTMEEMIEHIRNGKEQSKTTRHWKRERRR